ncbi:hypothetical protein [Berryella intestinalis]|uniref:hypothetical protein n=1 Tax=Berryella intestinalis TaxID=1531429 RepID=UPI001185DB92|nr:hypothetical protein [Berryella intestinalis]
MSQQSIARSYTTQKPRIAEGDLSFFLDTDTDRVLIDLGKATISNAGCSTCDDQVFEPPYLVSSDKQLEETPSIEALQFLDPQEAKIELDFSISGGFDNNAITVSWAPIEQKNPTWVALRTFSGFQIKYVKSKETKALTFALAGEDAYCYCGENPCRECIFKCKYGFVLYALFEEAGLVRLPVSRVRSR